MTLEQLRKLASGMTEREFEMLKQVHLNMTSPPDFLEGEADIMDFDGARERWQSGFRRWQVENSQVQFLPAQQS